MMRICTNLAEFINDWQIYKFDRHGRKLETSKAGRNKNKLKFERNIWLKLGEGSVCML